VARERAVTDRGRARLRLEGAALGKEVAAGHVAGEGTVADTGRRLEIEQAAAEARGGVGDRLIAGEGAVAQGEWADLVEDSSPAGDVAGTVERRVVGEGAPGDGQARVGAETGDAAAQAIAEERRGTTDGLVAGEGTARDGGGAPVHQAAAVAEAGRVADGLVARESAPGDGEDRADLIEDAAPLSDPQGPVAGQHAVGKRQGPRVVDAAPLVGQAVGDGQAGEGHGRRAADVKDAACAAAADGQPLGAGALDYEAVGDGQLAAQGDGAGQS